MREPPLTEGERIILKGQSCFSVTCATWKPGLLYLTNKRLVFCQPSGRMVFQTVLEKIMGATLVKGRFILGLKRELLHILYEGVMTEKMFQAFFAINRPEQWKEAIMEAKTIVNEERNAPLVDIFDEKDHLTIVMELPGVKEEDLKLNIIGDILAIHVDTASQRYHREVKLMAPVKAEPVDITYKGSIFRLRLEKSELR
jgi:HSP20 family molecular chaperone IbpA